MRRYLNFNMLKEKKLIFKKTLCYLGSLDQTFRWNVDFVAVRWRVVDPLPAHVARSWLTCRRLDDGSTERKRERGSISKGYRVDLESYRLARFKTSTATGVLLFRRVTHRHPPPPPPPRGWNRDWRLFEGKRTLTS